VITEEQRTALVDLAKEHGVSERLGKIVEEAGFQMLAHITVDRYDDVEAAIKAAGSGAVDGEIVKDETKADTGSAGTLFDELATRQADLQALLDEKFTAKEERDDFLKGEDLTTLEGVNTAIGRLQAL